MRSGSVDCLTPVIGSSERATYLKTLEAVVDLIIHKWYVKSSGSSPRFLLFKYSLLRVPGWLNRNSMGLLILGCEFEPHIGCRDYLNK